MHCNVCDTLMSRPIYESASSRSLTSLCELRDVRARVWSCPTCAHLRSDAMPDQAGYYASEYRISLDEDDEDQIYEIRGERLVYRTEHQVDTLFGRLDIPNRALMLDYGCAKGAAAQQILRRRPDVRMHLFDVSHMYRDHWERFVALDRTSVDTTPAEWEGRFDIVTSFFAIEHMAEPLAVFSKVAALLKKGGTLYGIVPDTFGNVADFVVTDHVNHFTVPSLSRLLGRTGFGALTIHASAHRGALVFTARKGDEPPVSGDVGPTLEHSRRLAGYWSGLGTRLRQAEDRLGNIDTAIYGSGFYGSWIASELAHPERIRCFLDRSPYQQGKTLFNKSVVAPNRVPEGIDALYVGLNPTIARQALTDAAFAANRPVELVFLDGEDT